MADHKPVNAIFGSVGPEAPPRDISVGDFQFAIVEGALRGISYGGVEIVRGLDCPIRDQNWGTLPQAGIRETIKNTGEQFEYRRNFNIDGDHLTGLLTVIVSGHGPLIARLVLEANRDFNTNRAGFTLLHPIADVAGCNLSVTHADGREETIVFPEAISPDQPVFDICRLRHRVGQVDVSIDFSGEIFEMEDQRNWTDASYKTYCRPLRLPMPYVIKAGETVTQEIRIGAETATRSARPGVAPALKPLRFEPAVRSAVCPDILLAASPDWFEISDPQADDLAGVQGVVARLDAGDTGAGDWIGDLARQADGCSAYCDLEIVIPDEAEPADYLAQVAGHVSGQGLEPRHVIAIPAAYMKSYQPDAVWPDGLAPQDAARAAENAFPDAIIGVGMLTNFTELNRCRPEAGTGRYLTFGTTAIVHAADDRSVLETLEALPHIFATAKSIGGERAIRLGLVSIGMRTNPYGAGVAPNPECRRLAMAKDDPRQHGRFAASFAVAATVIASEARCGALALAATAGPFSMYTTAGNSDPAPLNLVVRSLSRLAGKGLVVLKGAPTGVYGMAAQGDGGLEGLVTNSSLTPVDLTLEAPIQVVDPRENAAPATEKQSLTLGPCETVFFSSSLPL